MSANCGFGLTWRSVLNLLPVLTHEIHTNLQFYKLWASIHGSCWQEVCTLLFQLSLHHLFARYSSSIWSMGFHISTYPIRTLICSMKGSDPSRTNYPGKIPQGLDLPSDAATEKHPEKGATGNAVAWNRYAVHFLFMGTPIQSYQQGS